MEEKLLLIKYQDNFADNFTSYAYAKIISKKSNTKYFYENDPKSRKDFEKLMSDFNLKCDYISKNRAKEIYHDALKNDKIHINRRFIRKKQFVNKPHFNFRDINLIGADILNDFKFSNSNFLISYDILEEINASNSIGLYINEKDELDLEYVNKALKRLNKYVKKPILFIFTQKKLDIHNKLFLNPKIICIDDFREEFYLLKNCKHKIILNERYSYSEGFWAAILSQKDYYYNIYDKNIKTKNFKFNWIGV